MEPEVDVVVPVLNGGSRWQEALRAITAQEGVRFRLLVADNGSTDDSASAAAAAGAAVAHEARRSSYAARNAGVRLGGARVVAFTDADCVPQPHWLRAGLDALEASGADMCAGRVVAEAPRTAAGRHDRLTYLDQEDNVRRGYAATANLFVRRDVLDDLGGFDASLRSGGDLDLTRRAVAAGRRLVYAHDAVVLHPPRDSLRSVLGKAWRIGLGHGALARRDDAARRRWWSWRSLRPAEAVRASGDLPVLAVEVAVRLTTYLARRVGYHRAPSD